MIRKSDLLNARRCPRLAWLSFHCRDLLPAKTQTELDRMRLGQRVGELARELLPGGVMAPDSGPNPDRAAKTAELMASGAPAIFEGTFIAEGKVVKVDILERVAGGWRLIEVKSSKAGQPFKDEHLLDVFFQASVLRDAGVKLADVALARVNGDYVFDGHQLEPKELFAVETVAQHELDWTKVVASASIAASSSIESKSEPDGVMNRGCRSPDFCPLYKRCHPVEPKYPIYTLPRLSEREQELLDLGLTEVGQINDPSLLTPTMRPYWQAVRQGAPVIGAGLRDALKEVRWPALFLDFETCSPTLPLYKDCKPYQQMPFQWSAHLLSSLDDSGKHLEFLASGLEDPRKSFCDSLLPVLRQAATVVHYSSFERTALRALDAAGVPGAKECLSLFEAALDLERLVKDHFSHPEFRGKTSIKVVLPVLVPDLGYSDLELQDGDAAQMAFYKLADRNLDPTVRAALRSQLLAYCKRDTEAMVRVFQALWQYVS